jgi:signal peptidase II
MTETTRSPHLSTGLSIAALAFFLDQLTKFVIVDVLTLERRSTIEIVEFFDLNWQENCGIALSLLSKCNDTTRWSLVALTGVVAAAVFVWMTREKSKGDVAALALIFGGALGNIVDRVRYGYVVDFADLHFGEFRPFLIFNVADACITIGVLLLVARALLLSDKSDSGADNGDTASAPSAAKE